MWVAHHMVLRVHEFSEIIRNHQNSKRVLLTSEGFFSSKVPKQSMDQSENPNSGLGIRN